MSRELEPPDDLPPVECARLRAKARSRLQEMGIAEKDALGAGMKLEYLGMLVRPHERLPWETDALRAAAKRFFRERGM